MRCTLPSLWLTSLWHDERGVTVTEFALIAPALALTLMGLFDLSYNMYAKNIIEGAVLSAARDSTTEAFVNNPAALDKRVKSMVHDVVPGATMVFKRSAYTNYTDVGQAEEFTDTNGDGACNNNEVFVDVNGNGHWDSDRSQNNSSGARDAVLYEVSATYDRAFPLARLINLDQDVTVKAKTLLRNQPFRLQENKVVTRNCV
ncbi:TadE/TadG family type IV pilus assembly protein [Aurantiacibacter rhizosphaerae]|uniref:Pilus assembly protein n=1 Tax=Aurantiacibacter rhizosphaerae TaxID=2691582 RepID=A0A844XEN8_9SPHN|nr:TadE/TadG family type IV pilus assembly protein [Aurantiacibacter rhizosphaerae]MWV27955.1 pilus assembly protein [Aurantiacibacter rhizosphaerae]